MQIYTVHEKPGQSPAHAVFVPEGFSFWAFLFQPFWALYHRLWLVAVLMVAVSAGLEFAAAGLGLSDGQTSVLQLLLAVLIGAEARDLWRWTLKRRGYEIRAALAGEDEDEAELRYFSGRTATTGTI